MSIGRNALAILAVSMAAACMAAPPAPDAEAALRQETLVRLNAIGNTDWATARGEVGEIAGMAPGKAAALVRSIWPELKSRAVRKELVGAFLMAAHPDALAVAQLALNDPVLDVRQTAASDLAIEALLTHTDDLAATLKWVDANVKVPFDTARKRNLRELVGRLGDEDDSALATDSMPLSIVFRSPEMRAVALKAGFVKVIQRRLSNPKSPSDARGGALRLLRESEPGERTLKEIAMRSLTHGQGAYEKGAAAQILADLGCAEGFEPTEKALVEALAADPQNVDAFAEALGTYGRPEAIPLLIGVIAADNTASTADRVSRGLRKLTGVPYSPLHDGTWWRLWWDANRAALPPDVRKVSIPELPHTTTFREPYPAELHKDPSKMLSELVERLRLAVATGDPNHWPDYMELTQGIVDLGDPKAIPALIGILASQNGHSGYTVGSFALGPLTGAPYAEFHDGNWWKLWWEAHRAEMPEAVRNLTIPDCPRAAVYKGPIPVEILKDPDKLRTMLLDELRLEKAAKPTGIAETPMALSHLNDLRVVEPLIDLLPETSSDYLLYWLAYFVLQPLTGVTYEKENGRAWWKQWWVEHGDSIRKRIAASPALVPDFVTARYQPDTRRVVPPLAECAYAPEVRPKTKTAAVEEDPPDIRDVRTVKIGIRGKPQMVYRLDGFDPKKAVPKNGYGLVLILPGGDGSDDFRWFIRRIKKYSVPEDMLVAQPIAPQWTEYQARTLVWPTKKKPFYGMKFSTEEFIESVIADMKKRTHIGPSRVYTFAWSSSGPAVYTHAATPGSSISGAFIAMSVFRPNELPDPSVLRGRRFFIIHSPQDFIKISQAEEAVRFLAEHGAQVKFMTYEGGHGWAGDSRVDIEIGIRFLEGK